MNYEDDPTYPDLSNPAHDYPLACGTCGDETGDLTEDPNEEGEMICGSCSDSRRIQTFGSTPSIEEV